MVISEAVTKIRNVNKGKVVVECLEFPDFFAFALADKGRETELMAGAYQTVDKKTGELSAFNPTSNLDMLFEAKTINVSEL